MPRVLRAAERLAADVGTKTRRSLARSQRAVHARVVAALPGRGSGAGAKSDIEAVLVDRALREGPSSLHAADRLRILGEPSRLAAHAR